MSRLTPERSGTADRGSLYHALFLLPGSRQRGLHIDLEHTGSLNSLKLDIVPENLTSDSAPALKRPAIVAKHIYDHPGRAITVSLLYHSLASKLTSACISASKYYHRYRSYFDNLVLDLRCLLDTEPCTY